MANRYANLVGSNKIKDEYTKINQGFDKVEQEMDAKPDRSIAQVNDVQMGTDDTLTIEGSTGITISTNPAQKKVTITATGTSTPGPHGPSHNNDGADPIPDLQNLTNEFDAHKAETEKQISGIKEASMGLFRNAIINGAFDVWQRGTSFSPDINHSYIADRWRLSRSGGNVSGLSANRVSGGLSQYAFRFGRISGDTDTNAYTVSQPIEQANTIPLRGKTVTLSVSIRVGSGYSSATSRARLYIQTSESDNPSIATNGLLISGDVTDNINAFVNVTTSLQRYTLSGTLSDTINFMLVAIQVPDPDGIAATSDYIQIEQVQLNVGNQALPFQSRDVATETLLCQRYYYRSSENLSSANGTYLFAARPAVSFSGRVIPVRFPVKMRIAPTVRLYSRNSSTPNQVENQTQGTNIAAAANDINTNGCNAGFANAVDADEGDAIRFHVEADAEI